MTARNDSELSADERIWEEVRDRLMRHQDFDATEVEIEVEEAEVTLVGRVDSREAKGLPGWGGWTAGKRSASRKRCRGPCRGCRASVTASKSRAGRARAPSPGRPAS